MSETSGQLYTLGYSGWKLDALVTKVQDLDAALMDIRYSPNSRQPQWRMRELAAFFGARYVHVPALGNINYRGGAMKISDYAAGRRIAQRYLAEGHNVVLLCVCAQVAQCHRLYVATRLEEDLGLDPAVHLQPTRPDNRQERLL